jgi:hypothetical protein
MSKDKIIANVLTNQKIVRYRSVFKDAMSAAMDEYADQFALDFHKFLDEHTQIIREEKITLYRYCDTNNEYGNYTLEDILTEFKEKY